MSIFHKFGLIVRFFKGESLKILKRKLRKFKKLARLKILLKYGKNALKSKNIPKRDELRDAFKNIFCILIKEKCISSEVAIFNLYKYSIYYISAKNTKSGVFANFTRYFGLKKHLATPKKKHPV